ncbi:hypothetical protein IMSHALPRED_010530 [Imshaugia aleurites]|uniref:Uncharacterized protein n=1 Tax=Imshaugia aleurites TaxID=172621 RepID=A0A8H3IFD1_9LECA|nr:hypothetical protein IMSHALPRED_010530 [Imshaugia aleurites]
MTVSVCVVDYHGLLVGDSCISIALDTDQEGLLVFDNVDLTNGKIDIRALWPSSTHGSIDISDHAQALKSRQTHLIVGCWYRANAIDGAGFLRGLRTSAADDVAEDADEVAGEIDGYMMALRYMTGTLLSLLYLENDEEGGAALL